MKRHSRVYVTERHILKGVIRIAGFFNAQNKYHLNDILRNLLRTGHFTAITP